MASTPSTAMTTSTTTASTVVVDTVLVEWLNTLVPEGTIYTSLPDFADGVILLSIAKDVIDGFDFSIYSDNLEAVHAGLEYAYKVSEGEGRKAQSHVSPHTLTL